MKSINSEFVVVKVENCKKDLNLLTTIRNLVVIMISLVAGAVDLNSHVYSGTIANGVTWLIYFYGILAFTYIALQVSFGIIEHTRYLDILGKCEQKILSQEDEDRIKKEISNILDLKSTILITISLLINTMPITLLVGLLFCY